MKLNLGCGRKIKDGYVNLDIKPLPGVNQVWDLEETPLPITNMSIDEIYGDNVFEHIYNIIPLFEDLHRILKLGGIIKVIVPHCSTIGAYTDLTHKHFFGYHSFDIFTDECRNNFYSTVRFKIIKRKLYFSGGKLKYLSWLLNPIINLIPDFYERSLMWFIPFNYIYFELQKL